MKRTPLKRSTTPIGRSALKPWRRKDGTKMTGEVHSEILNRDRICFLYRIDKTHVCRTRFGDVHQPDDLLKMTVDGVKVKSRMGVRADHSQVELGVAMCGWGNNKPPSAREREEERKYLRDLYPAFWAAEDAKP